MGMVIQCAVDSRSIILSNDHTLRRTPNLVPFLMYQKRQKLFWNLCQETWTIYKMWEKNLEEILVQLMNSVNTKAAPGLVLTSAEQSSD